MTFPNDRCEQRRDALMEGLDRHRQRVVTLTLRLELHGRVPLAFMLQKSHLDLEPIWRPWVAFTVIHSGLLVERVKR
jgi:hypothetical protein